MFTLTEWLASPGTSNLKPIFEMSKEELNVCLEFFTRLRGRTMARIAKIHL